MTSKQALLSEEERLDLELSDLYSPFSKYTVEEKMNIVLCYFLTGKSNYAATLAKNSYGIKVPPATIRAWKTKSSWWLDVYNECKKKKNEELDSACSQVIHQNLEEIQDRVTKGDYKLAKVIDEETGKTINKVIRMPMTGRDLVIVMGTIFDKRQLLRGEATARTEKVTETDRLKKLEDKFIEMAGMKKEWNAKTIEGETLKTKFEKETLE